MAQRIKTALSEHPHEKVKTIERNNSLLKQNRADLGNYLPIVICAHIVFGAFAQAQEPANNGLQSPQLNEGASGEAKENQPKSDEAEPFKPDNTFDLVTPLEGQPKGGQPNNGGMKPLITPIAPNAQPPIDGAPQIVDGQVVPGRDGQLPDPANPENTEEETAEGETEEDADSSSEQEQVVSSFSDELFFAPSGNSFSSTLAPTPALGSSNSSISEMAALINPELPVAYSNKGLAFTAGVTQMYDTNPFRVQEEVNPGGDWITLASMSVGYRPLNPSLWSVTASYSGGYNWFLDNKESNSAFQNGGGSLTYNGARLSSVFRGNFTMSEGANRDIGVGQMIEQFNFGLSNNTRYSISPKTSVDALLSLARNEFSGTVSDVFEDHVAKVSGIWHYSPITDFGLGLRRTVQTISSRSERTSLGPSFSVNYRYSQRLSLRSQASLEFATINTANNLEISKLGVDTSIGVEYVPAPQWKLTLDLRRSNQPLPGSVATFQSLTGLKLACTRQTMSSTISSSVGYEFADMDDYGAAGVTSAFERKFFTLDTTYTRAVYLDRLFGTLFVRYSEQTGNFPQLFEATQFGLGFTHVF